VPYVPSAVVLTVRCNPKISLGFRLHSTRRTQVAGAGTCRSIVPERISRRKREAGWHLPKCAALSGSLSCSVSFGMSIATRALLVHSME
jgi:hypothetical protein